MIRTRCARWAAVRGLSAAPSVAAAAQRSAMTSDIASDASSRRAGSMRRTLSGALLLADFFDGITLLSVNENTQDASKTGRSFGRSFAEWLRWSLQCSPVLRVVKEAWE